MRFPLLLLSLACAAAFPPPAGTHGRAGAAEPVAPAPVPSPGSEPSPPAQPPLLLREVWVPYEEFRELTAGNPRGMVMTLEEYRTLALLAARNATDAAPPELPPVEAAISDARYAGSVEGKAVRVLGTLRIRVAAEGWVRCDLGAPIANLGRVVVDDAPGWIVVDGPPATAAPAGAEPQATPAPRAWLLLRGRGEHLVEIAFSLPVSEAEDRFAVEGTLVPSPGAVLELEVPGLVEAQAQPPFLETRRGETSTRLVLGAGRSESFRIEWKLQKALGEKETFLSARHLLLCSPRPERPTFLLQSVVTVARSRTDSIVIVEPEGATVLGLEGPLVHDWRRTPEGLKVLLNAPTLGDVVLTLTGTFDAPGPRREIGPPAVVGAFSNTGHIAIYEPGSWELSIDEARGVLEASVEEAGAPTVMDPAAGAGLRGRLSRIFAFRAAEARVAVSLLPEPLSWSAHGTFLASVTEDLMALDGVIRATVREGRLYQLSLRLPAGWTLGRLSEVAPQGRPLHAIRQELREEADGPRVDLILETAAPAGESFELAVRLERAASDEERALESRDIVLTLPRTDGAERSRWDLGVAIPSSMHARTGAIPGWRALSPEEIDRLGLSKSAAAQSLELVAGLTTREPEPSLGFTVVRRPLRGEHLSVTHLLALERHLRARTDIRFTAVDRPVDALVFELPAAAGPGAAILGPGIKEIETDAASGRRTVRFAKPWLGTRPFRVEMEILLEPGRPSPIPRVEVRAPGEGGFLSGERFLVLQSQGPVEIRPPQGGGLSIVDMDDLPALGAPWESGRVLQAYRFRPGAEVGTFGTIVHERAPVLERLVRELSLSTAIGRDGVSRTRAEIFLASSREQSLEVELPGDARLLAVTVDGEPVRAVISPPGAEGRAERGGPAVVSIPLPPQSYATLSITYERAAGTAGLGPWGVWSERAPRLRGIPVGETTWSVHHPAGRRFYLRGETMLAGDPLVREAGGSFAETFFGRLLGGRPPLLTAFLEPPPEGEEVPIPDLTPEEARGAEDESARSAVVRGRLKPKASGTEARRTAAPLFRLVPEGRRIQATKLGGDAEIRLFHASERWWTFSKRTVFWGTVALGLVLFARGRRRLVGRGIAAGLFLGTTVPLVLGWRSPLLVVPLCEGLLVLAVALGLRAAMVAVASRVGRCCSPAARRAAGTAAGAAILAVSTIGSGARAEEPKAPSWRSLPTDGVIIPYDRKDLSGAALPGDPEDPAADPSAAISPPGGKVYLPYPRFLELWALAHPGEEPPGPPALRDLVVGNAEYLLRPEGDGCRILATVDIQVLTDRWTTLPLPFDRAQLRSIRVNGVETGVAQGAMPAPGGGAVPVPFIELKGVGRRKLEVEMSVAVHREPGESRVLTGLLAGAAATLRAELPAGARVAVRQGSGAADLAAGPAVSTSEADRTLVTVDLGGADRIEIAWSFPEIGGHSGSQVDGTSFSLLSLETDGYSIERVERVRVTGRKVDALQYAVEGDWRIVEVSGVEVSEWSVLRDPDGTERLQVFLRKPVETTTIGIRGRARMDDAAPLATLALSGAVKQESYVGLRHGAGRRFGAESLAGMRRASLEDIRKAFAVPDDRLPDRLYQAYGSASGERLAAEPVTSKVEIDTDVLVAIDPGRLVVSARSTYQVNGPGPLRHEVPLPPGWRVETVECGLLRGWDVVGEGGSRRLVVVLSGRAPAGTEIRWSAERTFDALPERVDVAAWRTETPGASVARESFRWAVAASDELDLSVTDPGRLVPVSVEAVPRWVQPSQQVSYRFGLRSPLGESREAESRAVLGISRRSTQSSAVLVTFVRAAEEYLEVNARAIFEIRGAGRDRFRIALPAGAELVSLETRNEQSRDVRPSPDGVAIEVTLQSPASGEQTMDLAYRLPRDPARPPLVHPIRVLDGDQRVAEVDQYVGVLQTAATFLRPTATGLVPVEPETLPYLPQGVSAGSLQPTYRATQLDWSLAIAEEAIEFSEGLAAIVELAEITTVVGRDGIARTRVVYTVLNRVLQFLVVELPRGADLWGVTLNGKPVSVGRVPAAAGAPETGPVLRIPVEHVGGASLNLEVALQYEERGLGLPALRGGATLDAPRVRETKVVETLWNVHFPDDYWVRLSGGNVREVAGSAQFASKVQNLLDQYQKISKTRKESTSRRVVEQADREMSRLEQVLGDNIEELELTNRSRDEAARSDRLGRQAIEEQWARNDDLLQQSQAVQKSLRDAREAREKSKGAQAELSREEQAFVDTGNFLKQSWRGGKQAAPEAQSWGDAIQGAVSLETLLEDGSFAGLNAIAVEPVRREVESGDVDAVDPSGGLKPLPESLVAATAPGLEVPPEAKGATTYTFFRSGGDAELRLAWTRKDAAGRAAALVLLVAAAVALAWRLRGARRT